MNSKKKHPSLVLFICLAVSLFAFTLAIALPTYAAENGPWWKSLDCVCWDGSLGHKHYCQNNEPFNNKCDASEIGDKTHCQFGSSIGQGQNCEYAPY